MRIDKNTTIKLGDRNIIKIKIGENVIWEKSTVNYFYIQNTSEGDNTVTFKTSASKTLPSSDLYSNQVEYSTDNRNWNTLTFNKTTPQTVTISGGEKLYLRNNSGAFNYFASFSSKYITTINTSQSCILGGNINTLLNYNDANVNLKDSCFYDLFRGCTSLTDVSNLELPSTTLTSYCYYNMFNGCSSLVNAPTLPATTLADSCYQNMFYNCKVLTSAPTLPATTLASNCYYSMFYRCTSLVNAPSLPSTTLASNCYREMFYGCSSLVNAPELPVTELASGCYQGMFSGCSSLVNAPELPATTLASNCYYNMFSKCISLQTAPELPATTLENNCYQSMFNGCTSLVNAPSLPATTLADNCYYSMFQGCTSLTTTPSLPATTLVVNCYNYMFGGCTSLVNVPELPSTTLASRCYFNMFNGCSKLTIAPELPATTLASNCYYGMFKGCSSLVNAPSLPATTLADSCYWSLFDSCTSLVNAPELPATELESSCYQSMFNGCSSLNEVTVYADNISATNCTKNWLSGVSSTGTFYNYGAAEYVNGSPSGVPSGWTEVRPDYFYVANNYEGTNTISIKQTITGEPDSSLYSKTLQYSKDKTNWSTIILSDIEYNISLNSGEILYMRGNEGVLNYWYSAGAKKAITNILGTQSHIIGGNINTLINYIASNELTLPQGVFNSLFENDTNLTSSSDIILPPPSNGVLPSYAYLYLFKNCTNMVTTLSELPSVKQGEDACNGMFAYTAITTAPALPSLELAKNCYYGLFEGCSQLVNPPALPATEMAPNCYRKLFYNCSSLVNPPELPAQILADGCYREIFKNCSSLNNVTVYADDISATNCTTDWLSGVASSGTFNNMGSATYTINSASGIPTGWTEVRPINYFYIENTSENDNTITFKTDASNILPTSDLYSNKVEYSVDKTNWNTITFDKTTPQTVTIELGKKLYLRNDSGVFNHHTSYSDKFITMINTSQSCVIGGNINTLLNYNDADNVSLKQSCFFQLFKEMSKLTDASNLVLPSTTLADNCYQYMFNNCYSLVSAPTLPATTLASNCYNYMFGGCSSLVNAPSLPATTLADSCYQNMFYNCKVLTSAPTLPATTLANNCYEYMFCRCSSLTTTPELPVTELANSCYRSMFQACTSLTTTPELPATTLADNCYHSMFYGCTSLTTAPSLPATTLGMGCYQYMFYDCTSLTTAPELPATTLADSCYNNMFYNCTSLTTAPELPATTLASQCYEYMFDNCTGLTTAPSLPATTLANYCYFGMFKGCSKLTIAPELPATTLTDSCYKYMFSNCYSLVSAPTLPATTLADNCYWSLFDSCGSLNEVTVYADDISASNCTFNWLLSVANSGTFHNLGTATYEKDSENGIPVGWTEVRPDYFYVENTYNGSNTISVKQTIKGSPDSSLYAKTLQYSKDKTTWSTITLSSTTYDINLNQGEKVYFRGNEGVFNHYVIRGTEQAYTKITANQTFNVGGNINTLINYYNPNNLTLPQGVFNNLLRGNVNLVSAENLILQPSSDGSLPVFAYLYLFNNCTSLTKPPVLIAKTLSNSSYYSLFDGCSQLNNLTVYTDDNSQTNCTYKWLNGVASTGTLNNYGSATYVIDSVNGIPTGWVEVKS